MIVKAFLPLSLTTPMALTPGGVAKATIVSSHPVNLPITCSKVKVILNPGK